MKPAEQTEATASDKLPDAGQVYAAAIGERVRAIRSRRGIARKQLSAQSGISERYLAQIESGKANISIVLLQRLAQAMVVPLHGLLPDQEQSSLPAPLVSLLQRLSPGQLDEAHRLLVERFEPKSTQKSGIALIGIRYGGKSHLGNLLSSEFGIPLVRISQVIEQLGGMKVGEILELGGQRTYRRLEREALESVIERHPQAVVEAGGGLVTEPETFQRLLSCYYTIWIKATPAELMRRLIAQGDMRPLQGNNYDMAMEDLTRILMERDAEYRQADYVLDTTERSVHDCLQELIGTCRPVLANGGGPTA